MKKKTLYRTVIQIEVLSETPIEHSMSTAEIQQECDDGEFSGMTDTTVSNQPISGKDAAKLVIAQGTDVEFFNMDADGNEVEY